MTLKNADTDMLFSAMLSLKSIDECYAFFEDVCTIKELQAITQRLSVAKMLKDKKTFAEIAAKTGASTATISRVNKCLMYGTNGYNMVLDRIEH